MVQRLDRGQNILSASAYDAWGNPLVPNANDPFGYDAQWGYYTDNETGLLLLTHRYYDPMQGRFLTRDPIGYNGGVNLYGYAGNEVVELVDPKGLSFWNDMWNIIREIPSSWEEVYGSQAGHNYEWCLATCSINTVIGFIPLPFPPINFSLGPGHWGIHFNLPGLIGFPGARMFHWPTGRPPSDWLINMNYWERVKLGMFNGGITEGPAAWRDTGKIFAPLSAVINIGQEIGCIQNCLHDYWCSNGEEW